MELNKDHLNAAKRILLSRAEFHHEQAQRALSEGVYMANTPLASTANDISLITETALIQINVAETKYHTEQAKTLVDAVDNLRILGEANGL